MRSLKIERKNAKAKIVYKILNEMGHKSLTNLFSYKGEKTDNHLRDTSSKLCLPKPSTNNMKNSFTYDGAKLWNSITKDIKESKSILPFEMLSLLTSIINKLHFQSSSFKISGGPSSRNPLHSSRIRRSSIPSPLLILLCGCQNREFYPHLKNKAKETATRGFKSDKDLC